jgi:hypothetical protein
VHYSRNGIAIGEIRTKCDAEIMSSYTFEDFTILSDLPQKPHVNPASIPISTAEIYLTSENFPVQSMAVRHA